MGMVDIPIRRESLAQIELIRGQQEQLKDFLLSSLSLDFDFLVLLDVDMVVGLKGCHLIAGHLNAKPGE